MTNEEILDKILDKAAQNGFNYKNYYRFINTAFDNYLVLIFSHDFAKAFWGELPLYCGGCMRVHDTPGDCDTGAGYNDIANWQFHLQQLVLAPDDERLQYLAKFL